MKNSKLSLLLFFSIFLLMGKGYGQAVMNTGSASGTKAHEISTVKQATPVTIQQVAVPNTDPSIQMHPGGITTASGHTATSTFQKNVSSGQVIPANAVHPADAKTNASGAQVKQPTPSQVTIQPTQPAKE